MKFKNFYKRIITFALILTMVGSFMSQEAVKAKSKDVIVTIEAEASDIDVTVPTTAFIIFNEDGTNTYPENFNIKNNSNVGSVDLSTVSVDEEKNGWTLTNENTKVFPRNDKRVKFYAGVEKKLDENFTAVKKDIIVNKEIKANESIPMYFKVERAAFTDAIGVASAFNMVLDFNWHRPAYYSTIELAADDANLLTTDNADSNLKNAEASLSIHGDTANITLLKDTADDTQTFSLDANTDLNLNEKAVTMAPFHNISYSKSLNIKKGTINFANPSIGIDGQNAADDLIISSVNINHDFGSDTIKTNSSYIEIRNSNLYANTNNQAQVRVINKDSKVLFKNNYFESNSGENIIVLAENVKVNSCTLESPEAYNIKTNDSTYVELNDCIMSGAGNIDHGTMVMVIDHRLVINGGEYLSTKVNTSLQGTAANLRTSNGEVIMNNVRFTAKNNLISGSYGSNITLNNGDYHLISDDASTASGITATNGISLVCNNPKIVVEGAKANCVLNGSNIDIKIHGGYIYAALGNNSLKDAGSYGIIVGESKSLLIDETVAPVNVIGGNAAILARSGSKSIINGGTFKSPNNGGAYVASGSKGNFEVNGGSFINNRNEYTAEELGSINSYGGMYVGCNDASSEQWSVNIKNATIKGGQNGLVQKSSESYIPATINLYNSSISGDIRDLWVQNFDTVGTYNAYVNIYAGTVFEHNTIVDSYGEARGEQRVIDFR